jgi:hypothetical protein
MSAATVLALVGVECVLTVLMGNFDVAPFVLHPGDGRCAALRGGESRYSGYMWRVPTAVHSVNTMGYRGPARPLQADPGVVRLAALGDSFTFGVGVGDEESLPAALERAVGGPGSSAVEVLNFGIPGYNLDEVIDQYVYFARRWKPRAVVYFVVNNDLDEGLCIRAQSNRWLRVGRYWRTLRLFLATFAPGKFFGSPPVPHPGDEDRFRAGLVRLRDEVARDGATLYVVSFKDPLNDAAATRRILADLGIASYVLRPDEFDRLEVIPREGHFTARGNETVASTIAPWLSDAIRRVAE